MMCWLRPFWFTLHSPSVTTVATLGSSARQSRGLWAPVRGLYIANIKKG